MTEYLTLDNELLTNELNFTSEGFLHIIGVDEVGRGPLAGPVVAVAACFLDFNYIPKVFDSKALSEKKREALDLELRANPNFKFAIAEISPEIIDQINILQATHLAMRNAVTTLKDELNSTNFFVLIDGLGVKSMPYSNLSIIKGDSKSASIAAASIIAKVYRDKLMCEYHETYPNYQFHKHKGYGSLAHRNAIIKYGPSPIHRKTFEPIKSLIAPKEAEQGELF